MAEKSTRFQKVTQFFSSNDQKARIFSKCDARYSLELECARPSNARARSIPELWGKPHARAARSIPELFDARPSLVYVRRAGSVLPHRRGLYDTH